MVGALLKGAERINVVIRSPLCPRGACVFEPNCAVLIVECSPRADVTHRRLPDGLIETAPGQGDCSQPHEVRRNTSSDRYTKRSGHYPPRSPAEWLADGDVTCNIQCLNGRCHRRVDVRLGTLPQDQPWSRVALAPGLLGMRRRRICAYRPELA